MSSRKMIRVTVNDKFHTSYTILNGSESLVEFTNEFKRFYDNLITELFYDYVSNLTPRKLCALHFSSTDFKTLEEMCNDILTNNRFDVKFERIAKTRRTKQKRVIAAINFSLIDKEERKKDDLFDMSYNYHLYEKGLLYNEY